MRNLPPDYLYRNIPEAVLNEDVRLLLRAVVGGLQDRVSELRAISAQIQQIWDPENTIGEPASVLEVVYVDEDQSTRTYTLTKNDSAPDESASAADVYTWAASEMEITVGQITSATWSTSLARTAENRTLQLLAETVGARLFDPLQSDDEDAVIANQKRILRTYFIRLKRKGTAASFGDMAKLHGFNDYVFTPLWSRVSARNPSNIGAEENSADFSVVPQGLPTPGEYSVLYDLDVLNDGDIYIWTSLALSNDSSKTNYLLVGINGINPYVNILVVGSPTYLPAPGSYILANGDHGKKARSSALLAADGSESGYLLEAIAAGASFNSARVDVIAVTSTTIKIRVTHNLSSIKFRSSFFDFAAAVPVSKYAERYTALAGSNADLSDDPTLWQRLGSSLTADEVPFFNSGVAVDPYRCWSGGSRPLPIVTTWPDYSIEAGSGIIIERSQASINQPVLQLDQLLAATKTLSGDLDFVRPVTRFSRRVSTGFSYETIVQYAPHVGRQLMALIQAPITIGATVGPEGTAYPYAPLIGAFFVRLKAIRMEYSGGWNIAQTSIIDYDVASETDPDNASLVYLSFTHPDDSRILTFTGTFDFTTMTLAIVVTQAGYTQGAVQYVVEGSLYGVWEAIGTDRLQLEPAPDTPDVLVLYSVADSSCCDWMQCILNNGFEAAVENIEQLVSDYVDAYNIIS